MACVAVASLLRTIELEFLQYRPRPVVLDYDLISPNKDLIQSFHQKLGFLITQFDDKRINMDGVEAVKHLEMKLRDLAFRVEDQIEWVVLGLYSDDAFDARVKSLRALFNDKENGVVWPVRSFHRLRFGVSRAVQEAYIYNLTIDIEDAHRALNKEKPQRDTDAEKTTQPYSVKLGQVFQTAMKEIEAINEELLKITAEGRKTAHDVLQRSQLLSSHHASHSKEQMLGKEDEFEIIKKLLTELGSKEKKLYQL